MQVAYTGGAGVTFDAGSVAWAESFGVERNQGGQPIRLKKTVALSGRLQGASQTAITTLSAALDAALAVPYGNLILYDDSAAVARSLLNSGSISGVVCDSWGYPDGRGAEYTTWRNFVASFSATYGITDATELILQWTETLSFSGGGPLYAHVECVEDKPQKQKLRNHSVFRCTQQGSCVGRFAYIPPPQPLFPDALMEGPGLGLTSPQRQTGTFEGYATTWSYRFESADPLTGTPTPWPG